VTPASPRRAALAAGATLLLVFGATLAPDVTLWDAGEFAAAVESLGIPHPPGTPLYVLLARAWRALFPFLETVVATNLLAAACTATAAAIGAALVTRWLRDTAAGVAAGLAFGGLSTVWASATETEVYSASLLLSMLMLLVADRQARSGWYRASSRTDRLLSYLFALAPPLHLSAMVASPGAIALASLDERVNIDAERVSLLLGAAILAVGIGTAAPVLTGAGLIILAARALWLRTIRDGAAAIAVIGVGASAFLYLLVRARLDPWLNQGNPSTVTGLLDVMARRQYDVPGLWPRRAPLWLQIGNMFQYLDWQFAFGLDRSVGASWLRTPFTPLFLGLSILGSVVHRRRDGRSWAATLVLLASATLGVVLYLNLRAGPSYGYGILPLDAEREARERDYFFALGFAVVGLWAGVGAVTLARAIAHRIGVARLAWAGVAVAALPLALNWRAADRRREPTASLARAFAEATLRSAPPNAVLFVAGDNDTYPLWYVQAAHRVRRDVTVVTVPLLGARWYRAELARRAGLYVAADTARWRGTNGETAVIGALAERDDRPVAVAVALPADQRAALGPRWVLWGLLYVKTPDELGPDISINAQQVDSTAAMVARLFPGPVEPSRVDDPAGRYVVGLMACPRLARDAVRGANPDSAGLLASRCNFR
jgi:hypothetical protein